MNFKLSSGLCLLTLCGSIAVAQPPATRPAPPGQAPEPRFHGPGRGMGERRPPRPQPADPTDAEWSQVEAFMRQNSPNRWKAFEQLAAENRVPRSLRRWMFARWRMIQGMGQDSPELHEQRLAHVQLEDELFGLVGQWRTTDASAQPALRLNIREKVGQLIDASLKERRARIQRSRELLDREAQRLEREEANRNQLIDRRTEAELSAPTTRPDLPPMRPEHPRDEPPPPRDED